MVIQVLSSIAAVYLWPGSRRLAAVIVCWFMPLMMCVIDGIDTGLLLLWLVLWQRWEEKKPLFAGLALAMCIAKFHLFLLFPLLLFRYRRWKVIQGALIGFCGLMLLSFIAGGWNWPLQYLKVIAMPEVSPGRNLMLNIHGLLPPSFELPAVIVVVLLTTFVVWKLDYTAGVAGVLLGSLLCSYHAYIMDGVVLLPALFLIIERNRPHWLSHVAAILITPLPWIVMLLRAQ
jgi:Glycosyltransferase family 87